LPDLSVKAILTGLEDTAKRKQTPNELEGSGTMTVGRKEDNFSTLIVWESNR
jgi:hypothetical protein